MADRPCGRRKLEDDIRLVRASIGDVTPAAFRERIDRRLQGSTMTPGQVTRLAAQIPDRDVNAGDLDSRVVGVQLIYEGLELTRALVRVPPWADQSHRDDHRLRDDQPPVGNNHRHRDDVQPPVGNDQHITEANLEILVAEVLVARGFWLLSETEATPKAVETIRAFGRDETSRRLGRADSSHPEHTLEADVFELGIIAGVTATGTDPPTGTREVATKLAASLDDVLDEGNTQLSKSVVEELDELISVTDC